MLGPVPRVSNAASLGQGPGIGISNHKGTFNIDAEGQDRTFENNCVEVTLLPCSLETSLLFRKPELIERVMLGSVYLCGKGTGKCVC